LHEAAKDRRRFVSYLIIGRRTHHEGARKAARMALADFLAMFRAMPEPERLRALPGLGLSELELLQDAFDQGTLELTFQAESLLVACLYPDPPRPELESKILLPREMAEIMAIRRSQGCHLYHQGDAIRRPIPDHLTRIVHRARNGSPVYEALASIDERHATEVENWRDEILADLAATRAMQGGIHGNGISSAG
jgi:hypothetical protein